MLQAADLTIKLNPADDVVIARVDIPAGTELIKEGVRVSVDVPAGHKIATRDVAAANGPPAYKLQAEPARRLKNLQGIPIGYIVAERSGRNATPIVEFLKQAGCNAEAVNLKDKGILGNGHFMMLETNRKQVFDTIRGWLESKVKV